MSESEDDASGGTGLVKMDTSNIQAIIHLLIILQIYIYLIMQNYYKLHLRVRQLRASCIYLSVTLAKAKSCLPLQCFWNKCHNFGHEVPAPNPIQINSFPDFHFDFCKNGFFYLSSHWKDRGISSENFTQRGILICIRIKGSSPNHPIHRLIQEDLQIYH